MAMLGARDKLLLEMLVELQQQTMALHQLGSCDSSQALLCQLSRLLVNGQLERQPAKHQRH